MKHHRSPEVTALILRWNLCASKTSLQLIGLLTTPAITLFTACNRETLSPSSVPATSATRAQALMAQYPQVSEQMWIMFSHVLDNRQTPEEAAGAARAVIEPLLLPAETP